MKIRLLAFAVILSVFALPAAAQPPAPADFIAQGDKDKDNALSKDEWAAMGVPFPFPEEGDANKDGKISLTEMTILFQQFNGGGGAPPPPATPPTAPQATPAAAPAAAPAASPAPTPR